LLKLCGSLKHASLNGFEFFVILKDDFSFFLIDFLHEEDK
jgi:hypothetical protein